MGLFGTAKEYAKERIKEMNPAARIEQRINEKREYEASLKERMAKKEESYRDRALNRDVESHLKDKYARQAGRGGSFADRLRSGFEGAGGGMFGDSGRGGGGFSNPFDKMGFGGSSSGRHSRRESGGIGGDALSVLGVGGNSSRHSGSRGTTIHVHVGGSGGKKKRTHRRGGGGGGGFNNPMAGLGF